jgi:hypothetical protein
MQVHLPYGATELIRFDQIKEPVTGTDSRNDSYGTFPGHAPGQPLPRDTYAHATLNDGNSGFPFTDLQGRRPPLKNWLATSRNVFTSRKPVFQAKFPLKQNFVGMGTGEIF